MKSRVDGNGFFRQVGSRGRWKLEAISRPPLFSFVSCPDIMFYFFLARLHQLPRLLYAPVPPSPGNRQAAFVVAATPLCILLFLPRATFIFPSFLFGLSTYPLSCHKFPNSSSCSVITQSSFARPSLTFLSYMLSSSSSLYTATHPSPFSTFPTCLKSFHPFI